MVKIHHPTIAYSTVVARRRRSRAASDAERFRLGVHGIDCSPTSRTTDRSALIGAAAWALKADKVEETVAIIGLVAACWLT